MTLGLAPWGMAREWGRSRRSFMAERVYLRRGRVFPASLGGGKGRGGSEAGGMGWDEGVDMG